MKPYVSASLLSSFFFTFVRFFAGFSYYYYAPQAKTVRA